MKSLVGYSGFVGSNLASSTYFDGLFNSKNIADAFNTNPDLLVYAGLPAAKYLANTNANADREAVLNAISNIIQINPKKLVLISTIDVYENPKFVDEDTIIDSTNFLPYGKNRLELENWVRESFDDYLIIRLPGLYGNNLKKNFIYDYIQHIPFMLTDAKLKELAVKDENIFRYYLNQNNGYHRVKELTVYEKSELLIIFKKLNFSALNFTDSRGKYQFYNLKYLWEHIEHALNKKIKILNMATEPISIAELYEYITQNTFDNYLNNNYPEYDMRTKFSNEFNGENGYILMKEFILEDIKCYIQNSIEINHQKLNQNK